MGKITETDIILTLIKGFEEVIGSHSSDQIISCLAALAPVSRFEIAAVFLDIRRNEGHINIFIFNRKTLFFI